MSATLLLNFNIMQKNECEYEFLKKVRIFFILIFMDEGNLLVEQPL